MLWYIGNRPGVPNIVPPTHVQTGNGNEVRWEMRVHFARLRMKERGLIADDSPRGTWEISDAGREYLARHDESRSGA